MTVPSEYRQELCDALSASEDLMRRFDIYAALLCRWQARINLVGPSTLPDLWRRHFFDSAQLFRHLPADAEILADIGSGAGFPGLVLAIMAADGAGPDVHLIESDTRKAAFLREACRETAAAATVVNVRAEMVDDLSADVVTARACAPLVRLLPWVDGVLRPGGTALLLKGASVRDELTAAEKEWTMRTAEIVSAADVSGTILKLEGIKKIPRSSPHV